MIILALLYFVNQFTLESSFEVNANQFAIDQIGHYYFVEGRTVEKRDEKGSLLFKNSELDYGNIHSIDLTNPLQPILFYKEQGKIAFLDNTLSLQGSIIDLFDYGFGQIECFGGSRGDAYWLWDVSSTELVRVNKQFVRLSSSGNLSQLLGREIHPTQIQESGNSLYVTDPAYGVMIFDIYGNYRSSIPLQFDGYVQIDNERIIYTHQQSLKVIGSNKFDEMSYALPSEIQGKVVFFSKKLHCLHNKRMQIFVML
jgi:hypothetical protein